MGICGECSQSLPVQRTYGVIYPCVIILGSANGLTVVEN
ncbi:hypothetical protein RISK_001483 [Rhodopirellula islandica]|uniref:Uncharacterized protein n=1 Tax=Rhodopirellula islandica TaxID=595434 RepID=A0A0J1BI97_RHOIS|nr:hypothetical protein RISK_001483 [Rhodopirellula islandica]